MSRGDSLHLEILGSVSCQLEYLSSEVLQDSRAVHGCGGSNTTCRETAALQMTVDSEKYLGLNYGTLYCFNVECTHIIYKCIPDSFVFNCCSKKFYKIKNTKYLDPVIYKNPLLDKKMIKHYFLD